VENTLFYTFSTIAQTLASAIALLAALVLYRLQRISEAIDLAMSQVRQPYSLNTEAQLALEEEKYSEVLEYLNNARPDNPGMAASAAYIGRKRRFESLLVLQRDLRRWLQFALVLSVIVIAISVAAIAVVPLITHSSIAATLTLVTIVAAFIWCLVVYALLARKTVQ